MSLATDLLAQATHLAQVDKGKPKQANLRRSISVAYYALFHLLIGAGASCAGSKLNAAGRATVMRSFEHANMKTVCSSYAKATAAGGIPARLSSLLTFPIEPALKNVAEIFVELQEQRHLADYDTSAKFDRLEVTALIQETTTAFNHWQIIKAKSNAKIFLMDLLLRKSWLRA